MKILRVGIIGAGRIASTAAKTLNALPECEAFAIASRSLEKAQAFAKEWKMASAYGSYDELIADGEVDLVYVATPHSHHYDVTRRALLAGKPCLVEKSFMANHREAQDIVNLAREQHIFLAEALWTRYQPAVAIIRNIIDSGRIGIPKMVNATLSLPIEHKARIQDPSLCGGALLDLGVYALNFVRMFFPYDISNIQTQCIKSDGGVDLSNITTMQLSNGMLATIQSSVTCLGSNTGIIAGSEATLIVDDINNPKLITIHRRWQDEVENIRVPQQITGYEYEFLACRDALQKGLTEVPQMPHDETLLIMEIMDSLRQQWGVRYPMD